MSRKCPCSISASDLSVSHGLIAVATACSKQTAPFWSRFVGETDLGMDELGRPRFVTSGLGDCRGSVTIVCLFPQYILGEGSGTVTPVLDSMGIGSSLDTTGCGGLVSVDGEGAATVVDESSCVDTELYPLDANVISRMNTAITLSNVLVSFMVRYAKFLCDLVIKMD